MDLRSSSTNPNQLDVHRSPSSGLSAVNKTTSSGYGGGGGKNGSQNPNSKPVANAWMNNETSIHDVTPWVEQQKQQQSKVGSFDLDKKDAKPSFSNTKSEALDDSHFDEKDDDSLDDDDDLIPTAIVIKNIPFAIKKEQLLDVMTKLNLPLPYAFNYHFDNGVFRGLAFANFTSTDETSLVVNLLNGREIGGRKLRVEYKKMLPAQERERIEREKREKRGQLEEQHRSTSNASLASMISATSTTVAPKNISVNGANVNQERVFLNYPSSNINLTNLPSDINFNDLETLELFTQLVVFKDDNARAVLELAYPSNLTVTQRKLLTSLCGYLNLLELYDNGLIIIRRKSGQQFQVLAPQQGSGVNGEATHSTSMMNLPAAANGLSAAHPELLRSHSQSALPLPRLRQQPANTPGGFPQYQTGSGNGTTPTPTKPLYSNIQPFSMYPGNTNSNILPVNSNAALLRNGTRSYDMRATPPLTNAFTSAHAANAGPTNGPSGSTSGGSASNNGGSTPIATDATLNSSSDSPTSQPHNLFKGPSQPATPLPAGDINSRFAPFGQHGQLNTSLNSLSNTTSRHSDDFIDMQAKFTSLDFYGNNGGGIWGPK